MQDVSRNRRRLAAIAAFGFLWGAFLVMIGFPLLLVLAVVGGLVALAALALDRPRVSAALQGRPKRGGGRSDVVRLNARAAAHRRAGRLVEALESGEQALALVRALGDRRTEALTLNGIGLTQARSGEEVGALDSYETAVAILTELGDRHYAGRILVNLGALHRDRGYEDEARAAWTEALGRLEPGSPEHERTAEELRSAG